MDIHTNKIQNHIVESSEKSLIDKISKSHLEFELNINDSIKSTGLKYVSKKY